MTSFKPEDYSTVSPYLMSAGTQRVIDFLKQTFGAGDLRRYRNTWLIATQVSP